MVLTHAAFVATGFDTEEGHEPDAGAAGELPRDERWGEGPPPGEPLATWLAARLEEAGWRVGYRWTTPYGHAFDVSRDKHRYDIELRELPSEGDLSEGARPYLVTVKPRAGFFKRLLRAGGDPVEHELLCVHVHEVLAHDARISALTWHDEAAWDAGERGAGAATPGR